MVRSPTLLGFGSCFFRHTEITWLEEMNVVLLTLFGIQTDAILAPVGIVVEDCSLTAVEIRVVRIRHNDTALDDILVQRRIGLAAHVNNGLLGTGLFLNSLNGKAHHQRPTLPDELGGAQLVQDFGIVLLTGNLIAPNLVPGGNLLLLLGDAAFVLSGLLLLLLFSSSGLLTADLLAHFGHTVLLGLSGFLGLFGGGLLLESKGGELLSLDTSELGGRCHLVLGACVGCSASSV
mmetsp:Transcript_6177/g.11731  ORF Transcript_6177/g.11731 Transcript_6177/m.11731 type:complete len:234 (+) Transcript_6177:934-1635(+)